MPEALLRENLLRLKSKVADTNRLVQRHLEVVAREERQAAELWKLHAFKLHAEMNERAGEETERDLHRQLEAAKQAGRQYENEKIKMALQIADLSSAQKRARERAVQRDHFSGELQQAQAIANAKEAKFRSEQHQLTAECVALQSKIKEIEQRAQRAVKQCATVQRRERVCLKAAQQQTKECLEVAEQRGQQAGQDLVSVAAGEYCVCGRLLPTFAAPPGLTGSSPLQMPQALAMQMSKHARCDLPQLRRERGIHEHPMRANLTKAAAHGADALAAFLEGELAEWLFSACVLHPDEGDCTGATKWPLHGAAAVVLSPPPAAEAPLEALETMVRVEGERLGEPLLHGLALRLSAHGREAPLLPAPLQRLVLLAHAFGRCCRALEQPMRMRVLAFELARHRRVLEPALIAALVSAWPAPLTLATPALALCSSTTAHLGGSPIAAALAWLVKRSAAISAANVLAATGTEMELALQTRCCELLRRYAGDGWQCRELVDFLTKTEACDEGSGSCLGLLGDTNQARSKLLSMRSLMPPRDALLEPLIRGLRGGSETDYFECCCALELIATALGWQWVVSELIHMCLVPLRNDSRGDTSGKNAPCGETLMQLIARLSKLAPMHGDRALRWLCLQLAKQEQTLRAYL